MCVAVDWGVAPAVDDMPLPEAEPVQHASVASVKVAEQKAYPLAELLTSFSEKEELLGSDMAYCAQCKEFRPQSKTISFWRVPPILVIHLKRFWHSAHGSRKLTAPVDFPVRDLDLRDFLVGSRPAGENAPSAGAESGTRMLAPEETIGLGTFCGTAAMSEQHPARYNLYAVVNHVGNTGGGHYFAFVRCKGEQWFRFDDAKVSPLSSSDQVVTPHAYMLFYARTDIDVENVQLPSVFPLEPMSPEEMDAIRRGLGADIDRCSVM